jgi:hypothetical protein
MLKETKRTIELNQHECDTLLDALSKIAVEETPVGFVTNKISLTAEEAELLNILTSLLET